MVLFNFGHFGMSASVISGNGHNEPMMSAFQPIATQQRTSRDVRVVPLAEISDRPNSTTCRGGLPFTYQLSL